MAELNCNACAEIRANDPSLITDGWTDTECTSFKNDTGLNPESGNTDCEDLENMNDCLIGNMTEEVEAYEVCGWKAYMQRLMPNLWTMFSAVKCAICGLWTNVHNLWTYAESYQLEKSGNTIRLIAEDGEHGTFVLSDGYVTYTLTIDGNVLTLAGDDGSTSSVIIQGGGGSDVTYTLSVSGNILTLNGSDGSESSVAISGSGGGTIYGIDVTNSTVKIIEGGTKTVAPYISVRHHTKNIIVPANDYVTGNIPVNTLAVVGFKPIGITGFNISNQSGYTGASYANIYSCILYQSSGVHYNIRNSYSHQINITLEVGVLYIPE